MIRQSVMAVLYFFALGVQAVELEGNLLGEVSATKVLSLPAFYQQFESSSISQQDIEGLSAIDKNLTLRLLFGSWCHDSEREVPKIIKLVEAAANPNLVLMLTAISSDKLQPESAVARYNLKYTPTLVVIRDGQELGRIIEMPEHSWAADIVALAQQH